MNLKHCKYVRVLNFLTLHVPLCKNKKSLEKRTPVIVIIHPVVRFGDWWWYDYGNNEFVVGDDNDDANDDDDAN